MKETRQINELMDELIEETKDQLKRLKKQQRRDAGVKRGKYVSHLPKHYREYILRANKKGVKFSLSLEQFNEILSKPCVYCGSTLKTTVNRLETSEGYTEENSVPCCYKCSIMKYTHSQEDFLNHIKRIYKFNFDK